MREIIDFNEGWLFHRGDLSEEYAPRKGIAYISAKTERRHIGPAAKSYYAEADSFDTEREHRSESWENVTLPHDYVICGDVDKNRNNALGFFEYDNAWYIKKFRVEKADEDKRIVLYFEGVATHSVVYLNGCIITRSFSGYVPFEADITDFVVFGEENSLAVYVNTREHEGWWYEGGGIYRNVKLIKTDKLSVERDGVYVKPRPVGSGNEWVIPATFEIRNDNFVDKNVVIESAVVDASGKVVATADISGKVEGKSTGNFSAVFEVNSPDLWSPETPVLYTVRTRVYNGQTLCDEYLTRFGFRTFTLDSDKGLFINGKHYKIKGVCGHADCGLFGKAVPDNIHRYKVRLMKEMGANGYRTVHYMQSEALMDALDENGFIVMDETRWFDSSEEGKRELKALVRRDRNRPSVFFWSIGNEEPLHAESRGKRIAESLVPFVKRLDDTRIVMSAVCHSPATAPVNDVVDAIGVNYYWTCYDELRKNYPDKPVLSSECCATGTTRGWYFDRDDNRGFVPSYDFNGFDQTFGPGREGTWKIIAEHDWIAGGYQWIAFEHRGESVWPRLCSQSGAIDMYFQKKDAFYQNLSHFSQIPMIHLLPHWNFQGLEGETIRVCAYTNMPSAELFLNGVSCGRREIEKYGHAEWQVPYSSGELKVFAYDEEGKIVAQDLQRTSGVGEKLVLSMETLAEESRGGDTAIFTCRVADKDGNFVPTATPLVNFVAQGCGKVYSTGASVCDHKTIFSSERRMYAGTITVAVQLEKTGGELRLYAYSDGLISAVYKTEIIDKQRKI